MTAIVAVRTPDGVAIFSDGAVCDGQGVMDGVSTKPIVLPHLPAVLALRCGLPVHDAAARAADARYGNFDQLLAEFLPVLKAEMDAMPEEEFGPLGMDCWMDCCPSDAPGLSGTSSAAIAFVA